MKRTPLTRRTDLRGQPDRPTAGSLFSGIGGLDLAAEALGFDVAWQVENDPWRSSLLAARWPHTRRHRDIKEVDARELAPVDLLVAGPPCQPTSTAGRRRGDQDPRWLWEEVARLLRDLRPGLVLLEQPPGILAGGWFGRVLAILAAAGLDAEWGVLAASAVGAPHRRDRVWVLAHLADGSRCWDRWPGVGVGLADPDGQGLPQFGPAGPTVPEPAGDGQGTGVARWPTPIVSDASGGRTSKGRSREDEGGLAQTILWPTPKGSASHYGPPRENDRGDLQAAVLWPTPTGSNPNETESLDSWEDRRQRNLAKRQNGNGMGTPLGVAARLWATPTKADWPGGPGHATTAEGASNLRTQTSGALNPEWVETLMGYPPGWTDPAANPDHRLWPHQWPAPPDPGRGSPRTRGEPPRTVAARTVPHRARRIAALGDSVVPQCAATAFQLLAGRLRDHDQTRAHPATAPTIPGPL